MQTAVRSEGLGLFVEGIHLVVLVGNLEAVPCLCRPWPGLPTAWLWNKRTNISPEWLPSTPKPGRNREFVVASGRALIVLLPGQSPCLVPVWCGQPAVRTSRKGCWWMIGRERGIPGSTAALVGRPWQSQGWPFRVKELADCELFNRNSRSFAVEEGGGTTGDSEETRAWKECKFSQRSTILFCWCWSSNSQYSNIID